VLVRFEFNGTLLDFMLLGWTFCAEQASESSFRSPYEDLFDEAGLAKPAGVRTRGLVLPKTFPC
jgi:hypothetical protein